MGNDNVVSLAAPAEVTDPLTDLLRKSAEQSWRPLRGFRQLGKVIKGVKFNYGIEVTEDSRAAA